MELRDTVQLMSSSDYKERMVAEYLQTKIRYEKLKDFNNKIEAAVRTSGLDNGVDEPLHDCPAVLLREQQAVMGEYLHLLEVRAIIEGVNLSEERAYYEAIKAEGTAPDVLATKSCCDCVHLPICKYCAAHLDGFSLPHNTSPCDMFESVNGWGEERLKDGATSDC